MRTFVVDVICAVRGGDHCHSIVLLMEGVALRVLWAIC